MTRDEEEANAKKAIWADGLVATGSEVARMTRSQVWVEKMEHEWSTEAVVGDT